MFSRRRFRGEAFAARTLPIVTRKQEVSAELGVGSWLLPAAPSLLYLLPSPPSPFPPSLPSHLLGALAGCACVGAREPPTATPWGARLQLG